MLKPKEKEHNNLPSPCPVRQALDLIVGKWSFTIIHSLLEGTKRFKELERSIEGINTRMLVKELKNLHAMGVVQRQAYPTMPMTVEYSLTAKGRELEPVMVHIHEWAVKHF